MDLEKKTKNRINITEMWESLLEKVRSETEGKNQETRKYWGLPMRPLYTETYESDIAHAVAQKTDAKNGVSANDQGKRREYFERIGGLLLHEVYVVGGVIRYQLLDAMDRSKYRNLYVALKEHMRLFFRSSYNEFQKIMWMHSNLVLRGMFSSDWSAYMREVSDILISNVTLGPAMVGQVLMDKFMTQAGANLPGAKSNLPVLLIGGIIFVIGVVAEVLFYFFVWFFEYPYAVVVGLLMGVRCNRLPLRTRRRATQVWLHGC